LKELPSSSPSRPIAEIRSRIAGRRAFVVWHALCVLINDMPNDPTSPTAGWPYQVIALNDTVLVLPAANIDAILLAH
jgi:hypothetical protein